MKKQTKNEILAALEELDIQASRKWTKAYLARILEEAEEMQYIDQRLAYLEISIPNFTAKLNDYVSTNYGGDAGELKEYLELLQRKRSLQ